MQKWIWAAAAALFVACPAFAANVATCTLGADKKTVTVTASNPYTQVMACEVNCHMDLPRRLCHRGRGRGGAGGCGGFCVYGSPPSAPVAPAIMRGRGGGAGWPAPPPPPPGREGAKNQGGVGGAAAAVAGPEAMM